jgi:hypothetical protein
MLSDYQLPKNYSILPVSYIVYCEEGRQTANAQTTHELSQSLEEWQPLIRAVTIPEAANCKITVVNKKPIQKQMTESFTPIWHTHISNSFHALVFIY